MARYWTTLGMAMFGVMVGIVPAFADGISIDVPEPASLSIFAAGAGVLALLRLRR